MRSIQSLLLSILVCASCTSAAAGPKDPHTIYEQGCGGCHEDHASEFVFSRVERVQGDLMITGSAEPLRDFLGTGHGGLAPEDIDLLLDLFTSILRSDRLFETKCGICHDRAKDVARLKLVIDDGRLVGRYTGRDIGAFLGYHGRLKPDEIPVILRMFEYQVLTKPDIWP